jgi:hypothetical protein
VKTVQVKFMLQKQCAFGQRFLVVGDHPTLGLWDPTKATALEWSEDHVWTAKMVSFPQVPRTFFHATLALDD